MRCIHASIASVLNNSEEHGDCVNERSPYKNTKKTGNYAPGSVAQLKN
jgi:hypothetical protein